METKILSKIQKNEEPPANTHLVLSLDDIGFFFNIHVPFFLQNRHEKRLTMVDVSSFRKDRNVLVHGGVTHNVLFNLMLNIRTVHLWPRGCPEL